MDITEVLNCKMQENDANAKTIREYLIALAWKVWNEEECFSGKRPFGNSGWQHEVYEALVHGGFVKGKIIKEDDYEEIIDINYKKADELIEKCFHYLSFDESYVEI